MKFQNNTFVFFFTLWSSQMACPFSRLLFPGFNHSKRGAYPKVGAYKTVTSVWTDWYYPTDFHEKQNNIFFKKVPVVVWKLAFTKANLQFCNSNLFTWFCNFLNSYIVEKKLTFFPAREPCLQKRLHSKLFDALWKDVLSCFCDCRSDNNLKNYVSILGRYFLQQI